MLHICNDHSCAYYHANPLQQILDWSNMKYFAQQINWISILRFLFEIIKLKKKKLLWEKEKMLVTCIFSASYNIYKCLSLQG